MRVCLYSWPRSSSLSLPSTRLVKFSKSCLTPKEAFSNLPPTTRTSTVNKSKSSQCWLTTILRKLIKSANAKNELSRKFRTSKPLLIKLGSSATSKTPILRLRIPLFWSNDHIWTKYWKLMTSISSVRIKRGIRFRNFSKMSSLFWSKLWTKVSQR